MQRAGFGPLAQKAAAKAHGSEDALCELFLSEYPAERWQAKRGGFFERVIGWHEVDYDYYPIWIGHNYGVRIFVLTPDKAGKTGYRCGPS